MPYRDPETQRVAKKRLNRAARNRMLSFVNSLKSGRPCVDCGAIAGEAWPTVAFDFDHRDPNEKTFRLSDPRSRYVPESELLAEANKCDLRCSNCHRVRTYNERHFERRAA